MLFTRVIVVLTVIEDGLYRTKAFKAPSYVGDPLNAIRIFNEKEVDELLVLDISPERNMNGSKKKLFSRMAAQAFMPTSYGGSLRSMEQVHEVFEMGYDKIVLNTSAVENQQFVGRAAARYGSQSVAVSIDSLKGFFGKREVVTRLGKNRTGLDVVEHAKRCESLGAGELIVRSIQHDGLMNGYDEELISDISSAVSIPVVAAGGAGTLDHFKRAMDCGAHSVSAGSMFVYQGKHRAVLINYPGLKEFERIATSI